jgi:hypothetical protein
MERGGSGHPVRGVGWDRLLLEHPFGLCLAKGGNASLAGLAIVPGKQSNGLLHDPVSLHGLPGQPVCRFLEALSDTCGRVAQRSENALRRVLTVTR